jgi:hypothetical protein
LKKGSVKKIFGTRVTPKQAKRWKSLSYVVDLYWREYSTITGKKLIVSHHLWSREKAVETDHTWKVVSITAHGWIINAFMINITKEWNSLPTGG